MTIDTRIPSTPPEVGAGAKAPMSPLKLDPEKYREQLSEWQLTREQETELLQILWDIMSTFVRLGMGQDTTQLILSSLMEKAVNEPGTMVGLAETKGETPAGPNAKDGKDE